MPPNHPGMSHRQLQPHEAQVIIWRNGCPEATALVVGTEEANALVESIKKGIDSNKTYFLESQLGMDGRRTRMAFTHVEGIAVDISTGIVPVIGNEIKH